MSLRLIPLSPSIGAVGSALTTSTIVFDGSVLGLAGAGSWVGAGVAAAVGTVVGAALVVVVNGLLSLDGSGVSLPVQAVIVSVTIAAATKILNRIAAPLISKTGISNLVRALVPS